MLKKVLIVGRPNVGKSSLFNKLVRQRKALVWNQPGVTRDILKQKVSWWGTDFEVWDSGGLWNTNREIDQKAIDQKVAQAICGADMIVLIMDGRVGCLDEDKRTFRLVKKSGKPFLVLVNKVDDWKKKDEWLSDFSSLGVTLRACAFESDRGVSETVDWIIQHTKQAPKKTKKINLSLTNFPDRSPSRRILVIGKPNAGKSTLCNVLLKQDRMLTSPIKGTTVDVVEEVFQRGNFSYHLMDTAGFCRPENSKSYQSLAQFKMQQSFKSSDLVLLLVDSLAGPSRQDARLLEECTKAHKAVILVVSKWDLKSDLSQNTEQNKEQSKEDYRRKVREKFLFYPHLPVVFISALKQSGLGGLMNTIDQIYKKLCFRISTSELNRFLNNMTRRTPSPVWGVQDVKFYYFTQTHRIPPSFVAFANYPQAVSPAYCRFLIRRIQKNWNLKEIPLRISVQPRR